MVVYIKKKDGLYASPVFAELGKEWGIKSVVLNEAGDGLIPMPYLKVDRKLDKFNYFYIDETLPDGWVKKPNMSGFAEIVDNSDIMNALNRGESVSAEGLQCVAVYDPPLPVITDFEVDTERDLELFDTVCWGLHDATISDIIKTGDDLTIDFDTHWDKHIVMTFHNVVEAKNLDILQCILESKFELGADRVKWVVPGGFDRSWNGLDEDVYIVAQSITWKLVI